MSYSPYDHWRSSCLRTAPYAPVGVGSGPSSYLEKTSHPLINSWKTKITSQEISQKWDQNLNERESFQAGWVQRSSDGSCHESYSQSLIKEIPGGYSFVYQSFQEVRLNGYGPSHNANQLPPLETTFGGIRHSISHLVHAKPSPADEPRPPKRKRKRSRGQKHPVPASTASPGFTQERCTPHQDLCALPPEVQSPAAGPPPSHLKELNSGSQVFQETNSLPWSEHDSVQTLRSPIVGQENTAMNFQKTPGSENSNFRRISTNLKRSRRAKRDRSKQTNHAQSPSSITKVFSLPLDSYTFFGTSKSDESKMYNYSTPYEGLRGSPAIGTFQEKSRSDEKTSRRRHRKRSSQSRRSKEFSESSVGFGERSSTKAEAVLTENSSMKSLHKGTDNVMTTPMTTGRLLKHERRNSSELRTPTTSFEEEPKSRRSSPSKCDVKPKALIKPGLRSAKKDPSKTSDAQHIDCKPSDLNCDSRRLVQKTIDNFFSRSASKSFEAAPEESKIRSKGSSRKAARSAASQNALNADSHVRRIYQDDGHPAAGLTGLPIPVVRIAPLSDAQITKSESESVARLARVAPIVSASAESVDCVDCVTPPKRPQFRLRSPSSEESTLSPPRKRGCSGLPAKDDGAEPPSASGRTPSKRLPCTLQCCLSVIGPADEGLGGGALRHLRDASSACPARDEPAARRVRGVLRESSCCSPTPKQAPLAPTEPPRRSPAKVPALSPAKVPALSPVKVPVLSPDKVPVLSPDKVPALSPAKVPALSPAKAPALTPARLPCRSPAKAPAPARSPAKVARQSPAKSEAKAEPSADDEIAQAKWEEVNSRAEAALAAARNKTRHSQGRKVFVYCSVLGEQLERHPAQNKVPESNWSRWLNPTQLRVLTLAMLGNKEVCLNYSLNSQSNQEKEDFWMALAKRLNTVCYNPLTNLNTGLRLTVAEWKNLWMELKTRLIDRTKAMSPEQRRHSLGSLECLLFSVDLYDRLKKSNGECLGEDCPRVWCVGACVGVPSPDWSVDTCGR